MTTARTSLSEHGVMMRVQGKGVLLRGPAGCGKSSLALSLLRQGQQLVSDDVVDLALRENRIIASAPAMLSGLLHTRELGLVDVGAVFGRKALCDQLPLELVVELGEFRTESSLAPPGDSCTYLGISLPLLRLNLHNPASPICRLMTWIGMQSLTQRPADQLSQCQRAQMRR